MTTDKTVCFVLAFSQVALIGYIVVVLWAKEGDYSLVHSERALLTLC